MTERKIILILQLVIVIGLSLAIVIGIFTSNQNLLGATILFLLPVAIIVGVTRPATGFILLLLLSGYIEEYKRMTMLFTDFSGLDLIIILALPPCLMTAIIVGTIYHSVTGHIKIPRWAWIFFWLCAAYAIFTAVNIGSRQGLARAGQAVANGPLYSYMLFAIPALFPSIHKLTRLLILLAVIYIPVALYGIHQSMYGFADFEIDYVTSGYTLLIGFYYGNDLRPFSTLSAPSAFGACCAIMGCYAISLWMSRRTVFRYPTLGWLFLALAPLYFYANFVSMVRATYGVLPFAIIIYFLSQTRIRTFLLYFLGITGFVLLVVYSNDLIYVMRDLQQVAFELGGRSRLFVLGTYGDRLRSFEHLKDPASYTLFGIDTKVAAHDNLTIFLLYYGVVPLLLLILIAGFALWQLHRRMWRIHNRDLKRLATANFAICLAVFIVGLLVGSIVYTFPINVFMWMSLAISVAIAEMNLSNQNIGENPRPASQAAPSSITSPSLNTH